MEIRAVFAANLSRLCSSQKSISAVCRGLQINRTQFERYLRGEVLPLEPVLTKICNYFSVPPDELFKVVGSETMDIDTNVLRIYQRFIASPPPLIEAGTYFTYFAVPDRDDMAVRAITFVRRDDVAVSFRRVTGWAERSSTSWARARGNHYGIIVGRLNWIYFCAINRRQTAEPSMIAVQWAPISDPALTGVASLMTEKGPAFVRAVLIKDRTNMAPRRIIRMAQAVSIDQVDSVARSLLSQPG